MILGIGIDTIEVARVAREIVKSGGFKERYFSAGEIKYCEPKRGRALNYAARFAAKEAFFKALGTGYRGGLAFKEVEVINDQLGKPGISLRGRARGLCRKRGIRSIHISLTHIKNYASAVVIMEG
ncbi:MAG: holo-[acyl-carrier-protein] synthase [Elusimicrobia bacterium GWC2_51_8]|nr:MAG: holo-[acyl-carrier-protein] synthase [Elusimicrobia bacterium GWA2_51_34]OGR58903.1 MAG: holo-[acyl-carrier-protein] synthase [Elusimicrobia bacterium GWC2_51_8]OGR87684.1 MAG: holo-[acyl-carrier-protein] synthase [Elusimicrobia bacterium GWF2_52_66]HAF95506.1 holo-[acyl-carrier-protein] synthase [Elusimicrobiota bacterium]HCE98336.1 holo-[acyl-carrier-protein] synthase [Elusimicrobiota bacterium]